MLVAELRRAGIDADMAFGGKGLKGAMKAADRSGAAIAVILGERDIAEASSSSRTWSPRADRRPPAEVDTR